MSPSVLYALHSVYYLYVHNTASTAPSAAACTRQDIVSCRQLCSADIIYTIEYVLRRNVFYFEVCVVAYSANKLSCTPYAWLCARSRTPHVMWSEVATVQYAKHTSSHGIHVRARLSCRRQRAHSGSHVCERSLQGVRQLAWSSPGRC